MKWNLVANIAGQLWRAAMLLAFVPLYIRFLGIEAYGLIGILATLQILLSLLDLGLRPALSREMARFVGGGHDGRSIWRLLRTIEWVALGLTCIPALALLLASGWLAVHWVNPRELPVEAVARAFAIMGLVAGLQLIESVYLSALIGLQRQVLQNVVASVAVTVRAVGALAVLHWVSPTLDAFFLWQALVSILSALAFAAVVYRSLPRREERPVFSTDALKEIRRYALEMVGISLLILVLTQLDKVLLARLLPLDTYGHYMLAAAVAGALSMASTPVGTAYYPRMIELIECQDEAGVADAFHQAAQLLSLLVGAAAIVIAAYAGPLLVLWTGDRAIAADTAPLLALLVVATALNSLASIPYLLQLSYGWTALATRINLAACILLPPALLIATTRYGATGAAWALVGINGFCLIASGIFTFRRVLPSARARWAIGDIAVPIGTMAAVAAVARFLGPLPDAPAARLMVLASVGTMVFAAGAAVTPLARMHLRKILIRRGDAAR